jgi:hypothetical protein
MRRATLAKWFLVVALGFAPAVTVFGVASAQGNAQQGDNRSGTTQAGSGDSGDAVGGQVGGVVSSGNTSVDATNSTNNADVTSGDARGSNNAVTLLGATVSGGCVVTPSACDIFSPAPTTNTQEGDNTSRLTQNATSASGDAVAGEVIGVVTSSGGSADVVLANSSANSDAQSGDSRFANDDVSVIGLIASTSLQV